jgi:hypothetical protein
MKTTVIAALLALSCIGISCKKENSQGPLRIYLTDAPFDAQEVNVELKEVVVKYSKDSTGWVKLNTNAGVYNLLALQNNVTTLIATGNIADGTLQEIRLVLGDSNSIKIADKVYPLNIPSGSESGLKLKIDKRLAASMSNLVVDFDAGLSVIKTGSGVYQLKPVLKIK